MEKSRCGSSGKISRLLPRVVFQLLDFQIVANGGGGSSKLGVLKIVCQRPPAVQAQGCEGPAKPEGDVPGSVSFPDTLPSGVRGNPKQLSQGCEGPVLFATC